MPEIQRADSRLRRSALAIVACGAAAGVATFAIAGELRPGFEAWLRENASTRMRVPIAVLGVALVGPALAASAYCWHVARRIVRAERFPPPGFRVVRDTAVVAGEAAVFRGRLLQVLALLCAGAGLLIALLLWRLAARVPPGL